MQPATIYERPATAKAKRPVVQFEKTVADDQDHKVVDKRADRREELDRRSRALELQLETLLSERGGVMCEDYDKVLEKNNKARDEFFKSMADFYDPKVMKKHESPTQRLIAQKNSVSDHKKILSKEVARTQEYGFTYTSSPGKSYIIEPTEGELDYKIAYKDPIKFYDLVMK